MNTNHKCPNCESGDLVVREVTAFYLNSGEFFCNSVKQHDSDAVVACLVCHWEGERKDFDEKEPKP